MTCHETLGILHINTSSQTSSMNSLLLLEKRPRSFYKLNSSQVLKIHFIHSFHYLYAYICIVAKCIGQSNRPFPSSLFPLFQNASMCKTFHMKISSAYSFILMQIKVIFALRLALKQRYKGTQKWPIDLSKSYHATSVLYWIIVYIDHKCKYNLINMYIFRTKLV